MSNDDISIISLYSIVKPEIKRLTPEQRQTGQPVRVVRFIGDIVQFYLLFAVFFFSTYFSKVPVFEINPIVPVLLYAFLFVHMNITLMIQHVTHMIYNPFNVLYVTTLTILTLNTLSGICFK